MFCGTPWHFIVPCSSLWWSSVVLVCYFPAQNTSACCSTDCSNTAAACSILWLLFVSSFSLALCVRSSFLSALLGVSAAGSEASGLQIRAAGSRRQTSVQAAALMPGHPSQGWPCLLRKPACVWVVMSSRRLFHVFFNSNLFLTRVPCCMYFIKLLSIAEL